MVLISVHLIFSRYGFYPTLTRIDMAIQLILILPFLVLQERIVAPHLKHDYNSVCNAKLEEKEVKPASKLSQLFRWLFSLGNGDKTLDEL